MQRRVRLVHFVGFRDERYWNAVRIWGVPDVIHPALDGYVFSEVAPGDLVILASDDAFAAPRSFSREAEQARIKARNRTRRGPLL